MTIADVGNRFVPEHADIAIIGIGAAGLMASITAARAAPALRIVAVDGAKVLGAKILVAGGGRCNVTHHAVDASAYAGSTPNAIRNVLRRFDVPETVSFFQELGIPLKREETGKIFPVTDSARTVLNALLDEVHRTGVEVRHPWRVNSIAHDDSQFIVRSDRTSFTAERVILATGGMSLPKSGSDGFGYELSRRLRHTTTQRVFPALVPLVLEKGHFLTTLAGVSVPATLDVRSSSGKRLACQTNAALFTHFGVSGPAVLDISRSFLHARMDDPATQLLLNVLPGETFETVEGLLKKHAHVRIGRLLGRRLPDRLVRALCGHAGVDFNQAINQIPRTKRRALVHALVGLPLPVVGDRGFNYAEVTAGGVPLSELSLKTLESRRSPGLHLCGEICDVDGRIGGFNFQWAWASGYVAGLGAANAIMLQRQSGTSDRRVFPR